MNQKTYVVAFDDVALQLGDTGIARYWRELNRSLVNLKVLEQHNIKPIYLSRTSFQSDMPQKYIEFPKFDFRFPAADRNLISKFCEFEKVDLFVSSYYTFSTVSKNLILIYDLIPEVFQFGRMNRGWMERELAINAASTYFSISKNTKKDLVRFYPHTKDSYIGVGYPGIDSSLFSVKSETPLSNQTSKSRYFACVGSRYGEGGYKNGKLLVEAINLIPNHEIDFDLYFIGGEPLTEEELRMQDEKGMRIHTGRLGDSDLVSVLQGAEALVYPSKYEGFGMPPLEALALGTPVITTNQSSIPEAVGNLGLFVDGNNASELAEILRKTNFKHLRLSLAISGPQRALEFTWEKTAMEFGLALQHSLENQPPLNWGKRRIILDEYSKIATNLQH